MKNTIFREYDIRGIVGDELLIDQVYDLSRAIAFYLKQLNPHAKTVAVGMDGRISSPHIAKELCRGLLDSGIDVTFIGTCHSPMIYFATHVLPVDGGLMVTASHNPKEYNGIKVCLGTAVLSGIHIKNIGKAYQEKQYISSTVQGVYTDQPLHNLYIEWHVEQFAHLRNINLPVVLDCANGAAGTVLPQLVERLGWQQAQILYPEVDGTFPHHEADPVVEENMHDVKTSLYQTDAVIGMGFDGDADRMDAMTKKGVLVAGDILLAVFAQAMITKHPEMTVVYNVVCSAGLPELLHKWGACGIMCPVGRSHVFDAMHTYDALLGGETSCHFFFRDRHFGYDDGIYAMLRLVEIVAESGKTLDQLIALFPPKISSPEFRVPCAQEQEKMIIDALEHYFSLHDNCNIVTIDGVRVTKEYGWAIVRASNTQPVLSMRFESDSHTGLQHIKSDFYVVLQHFFDKNSIKQLLAL